MLESSAKRILATLGSDAQVLDVGGWASPFPRADWVIDLLPYASRGLYGYDVESVEERFDASTWVQRDICRREPWPFVEDQFDLVVCAHTLEDVRDPIWVCEELQRVGRAGYIEVPSRLEEQSREVEGPWVGWSHHRWLCDVLEDHIRFVHKPHFLGAAPEFHYSAAFWARLGAEERVEQLWWTQGFRASEDIFIDGEDLRSYLTAPVMEQDPPGGRRGHLARATLARLRGLLRATLRARRRRHRA
ncbi:MAG: class I SAM-dependent methyltransferase [Actinomycetota bacterium]|nr:class I SAM-dependent methyltransferase [Actinomycetota bacterium]